jgi:hypothetical protein
MPLFPRIIIHTDRPEGNAYAIMGVIENIFKQVEREGHTLSDEGGAPTTVDEVMARMMSSDYENLCEVASHYITIIGPR